MAAPTQMNELLQKRMDRKDFLKHVGMGVAILTGIAGVIKMFRPQEQTMGYGGSAYGGSSTTQSQR